MITAQRADHIRGEPHRAADDAAAQCARLL